MSDPLLFGVRAALGAHAMAGPGDTVLVAVSGGPDSLCLLHALMVLRDELGLKLHVAHLDHMLRGAESAAEAQFVAATAQSWGVPASVAAADVAAQAREQQDNLHQAARVARYAFLAQVAQAVGAQAVAVAHTASDQAETVLMHLLRGAGMAGLRGIRPVLPWAEWAPQAGPGHARLIRPLLQIDRPAIEAYCAAHGLEPRRDPTNHDLHPTRNRIRHTLLPALIEYNPQVVAALGRTAAVCADEYDLVLHELDAHWPQLARSRPGAIDLDGPRWRALHPALQRAALRRAFIQLGGGATLTLEHVEAARAAAGGGVGMRVALPEGIALEVGYGGALSIGAAPVPEGPQLASDAQLLGIPGQLRLGQGWLLEASLQVAAAPQPGALWQICLDAALGTQLLVRRRRPGDRFRPAGGRGRRRLQDMFVDAKVPRALRDAWPVVEARGAIVWVPGLRAPDTAIAQAGAELAICLQLSRSEPADSSPT